jgi:hypothetical protein
MTLMVVKPIELRDEVHMQRKQLDSPNAISMEENAGLINTFSK